MSPPPTSCVPCASPWDDVRASRAPRARPRASRTTDRCAPCPRVHSGRFPRARFPRREAAALHFFITIYLTFNHRLPSLADAPRAAGMSDRAALDREFQCLGDAFADRARGWETRFLTPPGAYIHVSKPAWGDDSMDGVHLEAYVDDRGCACVALHCEKGSPVRDRRACVRALAERVGPDVEAWDSTSTPWTILPRGDEDCSACETRFTTSGYSARETVDVIARELRKLQTLAPSIDAVIASMR